MIKKNQKNNRIYLRGHHLLCLQGYQGYGYDKKFRKNMDNIFHKLNINDINKVNKINTNNKKHIIKPKIILTDNPDDLCAYCPKLKENKCTGELENLEQSEENIKRIKANNEKIIKMDRTVLQEAKLKENTEYSIDEVILAINNVFSTLKKAKKICGNCKWENKCLWLQSREH